MKRVAIVSGKGGTGKTTFAAIIHAEEGGVIADCDVDAPNLHILLQPKLISKEDFVASKKAFITDKCNGCGLCYELCRFDAITIDDGFRVDERRCEGCGFCYHACPQEAIEMRDAKTGEIYISETKFGYMVHAMLNPGEENSGRLVSEVRKKADEIAERLDAEFLIIDASPGIGCPVIASLTSVDAAIIVSEPTLSGLSDLKRVVELSRHFKINPFAIINKYDLNESMSLEIERWCEENDVQLLGKIEYSEDIVRQMSSLSFPFKGKVVEKIIDCWRVAKEII